MEAIMRGGPLDGKTITLKGTAECIRFPVLGDPAKPSSYYIGLDGVKRLGFGQVLYRRTERLEGDYVVFR